MDILSKNKIVFVGTEDLHLYRFEDSGIIQPSVTTKIGILKNDYLIDYAVNVAFKYLERQGFASIPTNTKLHLEQAKKERKRLLLEAQTVGTEAHNAIERYIKEWINTKKIPDDITRFVKRYYITSELTDNKIDVTDYRIFAAVRSAENWFRKICYRITPLFTEVIVGDEKYSAGTIDFVFKFNNNGNIGIVDWKTSNSVYDTNAIQVSAYAGMFQKMTGVKKVIPYIAHLSKREDKYTFYKVSKYKSRYKTFKDICKVYDGLYGTNEKLLVKDKTIYDTKGKGKIKKIRET